MAEIKDSKTLRTCSKCKISKDIRDFYKRSRGGFHNICKKCTNIATIKWTKAHRAQVSKKALKRYHDNPGPFIAARMRYAKLHPAKTREGFWRRASIKNPDGAYFKSINYVNLLLWQDNKCRICNSLVSGSNLHVDHNHKTGIVRGILCRSCNHMLGFAKDNTSILASAIQYLKGE